MTFEQPTEFPADACFKYPWRKYQKRVLDELETHLQDKHLHVVAPPGSGKTILGLEVARKLNAPTLILAPTVAIRNQWIQRFCSLFLQTDSVPAWISKDIRNPKFLTVATYQGLHAACSNDKTPEYMLEEEENIDDENEEATPKTTSKKLNEIAEILINQNIKTVVLDEAHHLKNEWWATLTKIKELLNPTIIGLTATPPYDVTYAEWEKYIELNGLVDAEISVPELVAEGDLCPHQDYVYFSVPSKNEGERIEEFRTTAEALYKEISADDKLFANISNCTVFKAPEENLDWIYSNMAYYSAGLIFLASRGAKIPQEHIDIIEAEEQILPPLNFEWLETLLEFYLFNGAEFFEAQKTKKLSLEKKLRLAGILNKQQISFIKNKNITKSLTSSISKLYTIQKITDFEYEQLGNALRIVILTDFIHKDFLIAAAENNIPLTKLGAVPIFEQLRRTNTNGKKIGVLTGSLIIVPESVIELLKLKLLQLNIHDIQTIPLPYDEHYHQLILSERIKHDIVHVITEIFQEGAIEVLIGTKALLGEGWDAPAINALILASFVGSFVLSNQMRGRAIRTQKNNALKTGNIWHLVCLDPTTKDGGTDLDLLKRRFKSFVGVSAAEGEGITNGFERLMIPEDITYGVTYNETNAKTLKLAANRESLNTSWTVAIQNGTSLIEEIKIPYPTQEQSYSGAKSFYFNRTISNVIAQLISGIMSFSWYSLQSVLKLSKHIYIIENIVTILSIFGGLGVLLFGRKTYLTAKAYINYRDIYKDVEQIGNALLISLKQTGIIDAEKDIGLITMVDKQGAVYCHIEGGSTYERSTFIYCLQEILNRIENPRYIIIRKSKFKSLINQTDYHAVPEELAKRKATAEYFKYQWIQHVGNCELIFTRSAEGRKLLLTARMKSLSAQFDAPAERINKWR